MSSESEKNLLFVVFALQHDLISSEQLVAATSKWMREKSQDIGRVLADQGALDEEELSLLGKLVSKHVAKHGGDAEQSLIAAGVDLQNPERSFVGLKSNPALEASLQALASLKAPTKLDAESHETDREEVTATQPAEEYPLRGTQETEFAEQFSFADTSETDFRRFARLRDHAHGGLGVVSVAMDLQFNREVALKEIRGAYADTVESQQRFFQEACINGGLEHPGIVPVYAMGRNAEGKPYYAMRFIRGESLKRSLKRIHKPGKPVLWAGENRAIQNRLLTQFIDACNAIAYAHSRGVIHRDIKPSNIMVGKFGETLVVDWGLAKPVGRDGSTRGESDEVTLIPNSRSGSSRSGKQSFETRIGQAIGTPQYMSPEQASGHLSRIGVASDIFNLGATLYEILTGRPPYRGEQFDAIENGDFAAPREVNASIDPALEAICLKAMAAKPNQRYQSAEELTLEIEAWQADLPISAHQDTLYDVSRRWMRKNQSMVTGALAAMLVFVASLGLLAAVMNQSNRKLQVANQAQRQAQEEAEANATVAREQSELALEALNSIVFNVQARLKDVPAASAARRELLQTALSGLSKVSQRIQLQEGIARNESQALLELGDVFMSIGDDPELGTAMIEGAVLIRKANAIRKQFCEKYPNDTAAKREYCDSLSKLGESAERLGRTEEAAESYRQLMAIAQELCGGTNVASETDLASDENLLVLAKAHTKVGDLEQRIGSARDALENYQAATEIFQQLSESGGPELKLQRVHSLAESLNREGTTQLRLGDLAAAEDAHNRSLDLIQSVDSDSRQFEKKRLQAKYAQNLGKVMFERRKLDKALELYELAYDIRKAAAKLDPNNAMVQTDLSNTLSRLGEVYLHMREYDKSIENYLACREIVVGLAAADPNSTEAQLLLSQAYTNVAGVYFSSGDLESSLKNHERAREISENLLKLDPRDSNKVRDLAITWLNIGLTYRRLGEMGSAIDAHLRSAEQCEALYAIDPDDAQVHDYALANYWYLADIYESEGDDANVLATYRRAILFGDKVLERNPMQAQVRADQAEIKGYLALFQKDLPAAAVAAKQFGEANPTSADNWYNAACIYCLAAGQTEDAANQNAWVDAALGSLERSIGAGYEDFANMREDEDLAILRDQERFKKLFPSGTQE